MQVKIRNLIFKLEFATTIRMTLTVVAEWCGEVTRLINLATMDPYFAPMQESFTDKR